MTKHNDIEKMKGFSARSLSAASMKLAPMGSNESGLLKDAAHNAMHGELGMPAANKPGKKLLELNR